MVQMIPLLVVGLMAALMLTIGCAEQNQKIQVPAPEPVSERYRWLVDEKESNPVRSDVRVDQRQVISFEGEITNIDGKTVQFHIDKRTLKKDRYLQCEFARERDVVLYDRGQTVTLFGFLEGVGKVVKLDNCGDYDRLQQAS